MSHLKDEIFTERELEFAKAKLDQMEMSGTLNDMNNAAFKYQVAGDATGLGDESNDESDGNEDQLPISFTENDEVEDKGRHILLATTQIFGDPQAAPTKQDLNVELSETSQKNLGNVKGLVDLAQ